MSTQTIDPVQTIAVRWSSMSRRQQDKIRRVDPGLAAAMTLLTAKPPRKMGPIERWADRTFSV